MIAYIMPPRIVVAVVQIARRFQPARETPMSRLKPALRATVLRGEIVISSRSFPSDSC